MLKHSRMSKNRGLIVLAVIILSLLTLQINYVSRVRKLDNQVGDSLYNIEPGGVVNVFRGLSSIYYIDTYSDEITRAYSVDLGSGKVKDVFGREIGGLNKKVWDELKGVVLDLGMYMWLNNYNKNDLESDYIKIVLVFDNDTYFCTLVRNPEKAIIWESLNKLVNKLNLAVDLGSFLSIGN